MDFSLGCLSIIDMNMQQYDKLSAGPNAVSLAHLLFLLQSLILTTGSILDQNQIMYFSNSLNHPEPEDSWHIAWRQSCGVNMFFREHFCEVAANHRALEERPGLQKVQETVGCSICLLPQQSKDILSVARSRIWLATHPLSSQTEKTNCVASSSIVLEKVLYTVVYNIVEAKPAAQNCTELHSILISMQWWSCISMVHL